MITSMNPRWPSGFTYGFPNRGYVQTRVVTEAFLAEAEAEAEVRGFTPADAEVNGGGVGGDSGCKKMVILNDF